MKVNFLLVGILCLLQFFNQPVFSQRIIGNPFLSDYLDGLETIWVTNLEEFQKEENLRIPEKLPNNFTEPSATIINFDDVSLSYNTAVVISPNRYPGVSFYGVYSNSNTYIISQSSWVSPYNKLTVGSSTSSTGINPQSPLAIDFAQPVKDVSLYLSSGCSVTHIDIYQRGQYLQRISVTWGYYDPPFKQVQFNSISQKITNLRIYEGCSTYPYIGIDNVTFQPNPSSSPIGNFDYISTVNPVGAFGWTVDPDNPSASNFVSCYTDVGTSRERYITTVVANLSSPNASYPGNHGFHMPIPQDLRDGTQHTMNCYGDDLVGGDPRTLLPGSPKIFKFNTPIGNFDLINSDGVATGWSRDPDTPNEPNSVHFYIDGPASQGGTYIGEALANFSHPDPNQNGHGFSYSIPAQYRDGLNHSLYVYGIDKTGDLNKLLTGSPKTFNLQLNLTITNPRVSGDLSNTTQYALLGGDITLSANPSNGNYEWVLTGPYAIVSGTINSSTITIRSTDASPITAAIRITVNGNIISRSVNINVVSPSLNSYSAEQKLQLFTIKSFCYESQRYKSKYMWSLGCLYGIAPLPGILFSASIQIPSYNYLTDLSKSGVKYVQAISNFRKTIDPDGTWLCNTARSSEDNANTGWHLDGSDPYGAEPEQLKYFSQGNLLEITNNDSPAQGIVSSDEDAVKVDDRFEMYVVYFSGDNPATPHFQKRIGSLSWRWGGVRSFKHPFNQSGGAAPYQVQEYYGVQGHINKDDVVSTRTYNPMPVLQIPFTPCRGITSLVDSSIFFVSQQYRDFLSRQPSDNERETGRYPIASCAFNADCISYEKAKFARELFRHPDFVATHPELNPSGEGTHDFNVNFVRWCYFVFLRSTCEPAQCDSRSFNKLVGRLDITGDYVDVVKQFINTSVYKNRFPLPSQFFESSNAKEYNFK